MGDKTIESVLRRRGTPETVLLRSLVFSKHPIDIPKQIVMLVVGVFPYQFGASFNFLLGYRFSSEYVKL